MIDIFFIDFMTLVDDAGSLMPASAYALKDVVAKEKRLKIVCINTEYDALTINYDSCINALSQMLNAKKSMFDALKIQSYDEVVDAMKKFMHKDDVKSFAIAANASKHKTLYEELGKSYPNNIISCDMFSEAQAKDVCWMLSSFNHALDDESRVFFTSDTHFGHKNIIKYCNRPWNHGKDESNEVVATDEDVLAMDNEMIARWNEYVRPNDIVWHLGDFALGGKETAMRVFPKLNGKINLVMGNHDHYKMKWYYDLGFNKVYDHKVIINDFVILAHAPLMFLNNNCPFYQIFGHVHDSPAFSTWSKTGCCVCVERHDYYPVSWKTIKQKYDEMNGSEDDE